MVVGTTKTGEKVDLGTITIVGTNQSSYPSGGPTVPGSSTGIGSTFTPSQTSTYRTTTGGGSSSAPKPPQVYSSQLLQQNFTSAAERDKAENIYRQEQARQQQIAFSKTGGLVAPGQTSTYFKVRSQDVKTDSQAIRQAVGMADQLTSKQIQQRNILGMPTGKKLNVVEKGGKTYAPVPGTNIGVEVDPNKWKGFFDEVNVVDVRKNPNAIDITTGQPVASSKAKQAIEANISGQVLREDKGYEFLASFVGGGGKEIAGLTTNIVSRGVSRLAYPITTGVSRAVGPSLNQAATQITKLLSPTGTASQAGRLGIGSPTAEATKQVVVETAKKVVGSEQFKTLLKTETTGEALRQAGLYTPELFSAGYLFATPDRKFNPNKKTDELAVQVYQSSRVEYYGGQQNLIDSKGNVVETKQVEGKAPIWEKGASIPGLGNVGGAESFLPGIKVATGFAKTFEEQTKTELKNDPEYNKLTSKKDKLQYEKEFKDYYLNIGQISGTIGQVLIETGDEVTGGGRLYAISGIGGDISTSGGAALKFGVASGTTGIQEGVYSSELQAKVEKRTLTDQERLQAAIMGGTFAGGFGALQGASTGSRYNRAVNIVGELADYPGEPLGDLLGGGVKNILRVPDIKIGGNLVKTSFGPSISSTTDVKVGANTKQSGNTKSKSGTDFFIKTPGSDIIPGTKLVGETKTNLTKQEIQAAQKAENQMNNLINQGKINIDIPGIGINTNIDNKDKGNVPPQDDNKDDGGKVDDEQKQDEEQKDDVTTNTGTFTNVPSSVSVIDPQGFLFPGFFPIGSSQRSGTRQQTRIYDELAAAGKRFEQISGLPFTQQPVKRVKPKSVLIDGKNYKIGKRLFK